MTYVDAEYQRNLAEALRRDTEHYEYCVSSLRYELGVYERKLSESKRDLTEVERILGGMRN